MATKKKQQQISTEEPSQIAEPQTAEETTLTVQSAYKPPSKALAMLRKMEGFVAEHVDPTTNVMRGCTPAVRYIFGKGGGLPYGFTAAVYGPAKSGKSLLCAAMVGQMHKDDPESVCLYFSTEGRFSLQVTDETMGMFGIDKKRIFAVENNSPTIFDFIEQEVPSMIQEGMKIRCIVIDSANAIRGLRDMNAESVEKNQIGDEAMTLKKGLNRIANTIRKYKIAVLIINQARAEMDPAEQMRGNVIRMAAANPVKHFCEYFILVQRVLSKAGKANLLGESFENAAEEITAHRIKVTNKDASVGYGIGRVGYVTIDYRKGFINQHEEIFEIANTVGIIGNDGGSWLRYKDRRFQGKAACLKAIQEDAELAKSIQADLLERDSSDEGASAATAMAVEKQERQESDDVFELED